MTRAAAALVACLALGAVQTPGPLVLHLSHKVDPERIVMSYHPRAPGSRYVNGIPASRLSMPGPEDIALYEIGRGGEAIRPLDVSAGVDVVLYCAGYQFALISVPSMPESHRVNVELVPLGTVPIHGAVQLADPGQLTLEIGYDPSSIVMPFFFPRESAGSFLSSDMSIASTPIAADGAFVATIPDLLRDPAVLRHGAGTLLRFFARRRDGSGAYRLAPAGAPPSGGLPLAASYPGPITLVSVR